MNIEYISVSRGKTYQNCAQHYKYYYHLKTPSPIEEAFYFVYGKIIHRIAEEFVLQKGLRSINEIGNDVLKGRIEIEPGIVAPPLPDDYARRYPLHLKSILTLTSKIGTDGIVEHPFYYDLAPPQGIHAKGFIDRIIIQGDKAFLIDYKTTKKGKWRVNKHTVKTDLQLRTYARIVQQEFGIAPQNISCALYYLEDGELIASRYSEASLISAQQELLDLYLEIEAKDPNSVVGSVGEHCKRCPYFTICPYGKSVKNAPAWNGDMSALFG